MRFMVADAVVAVSAARCADNDIAAAKNGQALQSCDMMRLESGESQRRTRWPQKERRATVHCHVDRAHVVGQQRRARRRVLQGGVRRSRGVSRRGSIRSGRVAPVGAGREFWVADESPEHQNFSPETIDGSTVRMILTAPDPDALFMRAVAAGARQVCRRWPTRTAGGSGASSIRSAIIGRSVARSRPNTHPRPKEHAACFDRGQVENPARFERTATAC